MRIVRARYELFKSIELCASNVIWSFVFVFCVLPLSARGVCLAYDYDERTPIAQFVCVCDFVCFSWFNACLVSG